MQNYPEFQNAPLAVLSFDSAYKVTWVNDAAIEIDARLAPGQDIRDIFSAYSTESSRQWFSSGQGNLSINAETSAGERVLLQTWMSPNTKGVYLSFVTKQLVKSPLQERRDILGEASDQAWESICITDAELDLPGPKFVYVNRGYEELFGFTEAEVIGKTPRIHQGPLTDKSVLKRLKTDLKSGKSYHGEAINYRKNGEPFWLEWKVCPVINELGVVSRFISFQRDVTALKEARQRLDEFHSTLSHELRAPLTSVLGSLKLLQSFHAPVDAKPAELLKIALTCSDRLVRLLDELLDLSKLEAGKIELKKTVSYVPELLLESVTSLETYQLNKKIHFETAALEASVCVDRDRIIQVLINLLSNAIKFSPTNATVHISARRTKNHSIRFSVRDEGPGISKEDQTKLFQKFRQLKAEEGAAKAGTGLGLAIASALVSEHGGSIGVSSEIGQGAEFWFELEEAITPNPNASRC